MDSLSQGAARLADGVAQVLCTYVFDAVGGELDDLQGRVLLQHAGEMQGAVVGQTVTARTRGEVVRSRWRFWDLHQWFPNFMKDFVVFFGRQLLLHPQKVWRTVDEDQNHQGVLAS